MPLRVFLFCVLVAAALHASGEPRELPRGATDGGTRICPNPASVTLVPKEVTVVDEESLGEPLPQPTDRRLIYLMTLVPLTLITWSGALLWRNRRLKRDLERRVQYSEGCDPLTGLPARPLLHEALVRALARADPIGHIVAVLFVDLDRFKAVNDTFGHAYGDRVVVETALRLQSCVPGDATVARISSDEFAIVLVDLSRGDHAATFAGRILTHMQQPFDLDGKPIYCTASVGIAVYPGDGTKADTLLQNADIAMCRAKEYGGNSFRFFLPEMHERAVRRLQVETALRGALDRDEFVLSYQPKLDVRTRAVTGFEALLRWRHPELGLLSPAEFVPVLEDTDLIVPVGRWVLHEVCRQIARWASQGIEVKPVAVNLSARQFRMANLDRTVVKIVAEAGIHPSLIELEITESLLMQDPEETAIALEKLERYGVRIAVDDFGTGYSSLAYLTRFPLAALKIDRTFVSDAVANAETAAVALAIINLGHGLGLKVIAEGVETPEQLDFLRAHGCDEIQGFVFSPPISGDQAGEMMRRSG